MQRPPDPGRRRAGAARAAAWSGAFASRVGARSLGPGALAAGAWGWVAGALAKDAEERRLFPWIAVAFGLGIVLAFAAEGPLSAWPPALAGAGAAGLAYRFRARPVARPALVGIAAAFFGFTAAVVRQGSVAAPVLGRIATAPLAGFVESVEERGRGGRIVIAVVSLDRVEPAERPMRVRVTVRELGAVAPGDFVRGTARLLPLPEAARPGGFDFGRDLYFHGIGGVGSIAGRLTVADSPTPPDLALKVAALVDRARNVLTRRIADTIGGQAGAVAAALVTGKRGLIDDRTNDVLRAAGIYHVVSISGLHMALAAGAFFFLARALLALSPTLALGWPIKKIAAAIGMVGATAYCIFSGADVAAERSLLMILVMQGAILVDRPALSLRNLAISGLLVLSREPESILGPSFQMSYAAVAGLIALAEWSRRRGGAAQPATRVERVLRWAAALVAGVVLTTVAASVATGPFATYHFQNLQPYGVIGNGLTLPLVSFVVMPGALSGSSPTRSGSTAPSGGRWGWASRRCCACPNGSRGSAARSSPSRPSARAPSSSWSWRSCSSRCPAARSGRSPSCRPPPASRSPRPRPGRTSMQAGTAPRSAGATVGSSRSVPSRPSRSSNG